MVANRGRVTTVLFDVTGVLVTERLSTKRLARIFSADTHDTEFVSLLDKAIWFNRLAHDKGLSDEAFWDRVSGDCGLPKPSENVLSQLVNEDISRVCQPDARAYHIAKQLLGSGMSLGILANAPSSVGHVMRSAQWAKIFDSMTFSSDLGHTKPDHAIYRAAIASTHEDPDKILFIDDRSKNLRPAEIMGMNVLEWTSASDAQESLTRCGIL